MGEKLELNFDIDLYFWYRLFFWYGIGGNGGLGN